MSKPSKKSSSSTTQNKTNKNTNRPLNNTAGKNDVVPKVPDSSCAHTLSKDKEISLLSEQIRELRTEYISIQSSFLTMTTISFGGYGLILYYTFVFDTDPEKVNYLFLALPFLFGLSSLNVLKYTIKMLGMGAYISHLEKAINNLAEKNIFAWHSKISYVNGYNIVGVAHIPINIALYIMIGIKFVENMVKIKTVEPGLYYSLFTCTIILLVIILFAIYVCATQYEAAKACSKKVYKSHYKDEIPSEYLPDITVAKDLAKRIFCRNKKGGE